MTERILGIDLGIASLGWSVVQYDKDNDENNKIIDCGVRLFTAAETPKDQKSLNEARSKARGLRRVIKRRQQRMNKIKNLCISNGLLEQNDLSIEEGIFNSNANRNDVWMLRHDALYRLLSGSELARILIHISKHRGFKF
ncbi:MAG: type II CRISPR RNA-guided endonuclease Cas9, partial [Sulfuricurvum sp.]